MQGFFWYKCPEFDVEYIQIKSTLDENIDEVKIKKWTASLLKGYEKLSCAHMRLIRGCWFSYT